MCWNEKKSSITLHTIYMAFQVAKVASLKVLIPVLTTWREKRKETLQTKIDLLNLSEGKTWHFRRALRKYAISLSSLCSTAVVITQCKISHSSSSFKMNVTKNQNIWECFLEAFIPWVQLFYVQNLQKLFIYPAKL